MNPSLPAPATLKTRRQPAQRVRALDFANDPLGMLERLTAAQGDIVEVRFGRHRAFILNHPDLIRDVLVTNARLFMKGEGLQRAKRLLGEGLLTSEGEFHLRQRRLLQPVFLKSRIREYAAAMGRHAERTASRWQAGQELDIAAEMNRLTLAVVGETLFSADVERDAGEVGEALDTAISMFERLSSPLAPLLERLPFGPLSHFRQARERLDGIILRMIEERRGAEESLGDLLSLLLSARYDDGSAMEPGQIRDEALTILLAGHETTSNALVWTWLQLSGQPEVARKLHEEATAILGEDPPSFEHVERLVYTRQVIAESMRLRPPAWLIGRTALADYTVDHEGERYVMPRGSLLVVSQWIMHRDPRFWDSPLEFRPERWENPNPEQPKFAYFPFGAGPRQCIGEGFAWMEAVLLLATLARHWRLELTRQPPGMQPRITLRPDGPMWMRVKGW